MVMFEDCFTDFFANDVAMTDFEATTSAIFWTYLKKKFTSSLNFSEDIFYAIFSLQASYAVMPSAVKIYLIAFFSPTIFDNLCVPPIPGIKPKLISGKAKWDFSEAKIKSQSRAN